MTRLIRYRSLALARANTRDDNSPSTVRRARRRTAVLCIVLCIGIPTRDSHMIVIA